MPSVKVSPKYQIVIPKEVRERLGIRPGQRLHIAIDDDRLILVPVPPIDEMRGFLGGIGAFDEREKEDRT